MIKVVSNSQNMPVSVSSIGVNAVNNSITQKIKFKTPLPKPKVKATKFKPMVPIQRPSILSVSSSSLHNNTENALFGSPSLTQTSPSKSSSLSQGMSVKVVQVTKSSGQGSTSSLISNLNKPVVVVSNNAAVKAPSQKLTFNTVPSSITQQLKVASAASLSTSITQSLPKGTLTSKSMPLATGFKMIAVTTVVPGTTQVKTVYIATPIMSLTKTVSQTTGSSITTPATQNVRHTSSSLASNLQSVVARSINTCQLGSVGKAANIQTISTASSMSSINNSISINKTNRLSSATTIAATISASPTPAHPKGLGSLKATLAGAAQSLKLFTAVSKTRSSLTNINTSKSTPLLPSTSLLTSVVSQQQSVQRIGTVPVRLNEATVSRMKNDKQDISSITVQSTSSNTFLNISSVGVSAASPQISNGIVHSGDMSSLQAALALNTNSLEEVSATLNLLNEDNSTTATTERITATATADTDDMAFLNAGEKFLEQLSAKMTATSPDTLSKNDTFLFPSSLTLDLPSDSSQMLLDEISANHLASGGITIDKGVILQNGNGIGKQPPLIAKDSSYLLSQKVLSNAPKILNNILPAGTKLLQQASSSLNSAVAAGTNSVMVAPVFQQKTDYNSRSVLNYTNIATNVGGGNTELVNNRDSSTVGFINIGGSTSGSITIDGNPVKSRVMNSIKITSPQTSNKLPMSIPGSSKLNISPLLVSNAKTVCADIGGKKVNVNSDSQNNCTVTQVMNKSLNSLTNVQFFVSPTTRNDSLNTGAEKSLNNDVSSSLDPLKTNAMINDSKKRKFIEITAATARSQASWVRSAAK